MPNPEVVKWTGKILATARKGQNDKALSCFPQMLRADVDPNVTALCTTLTVCGHSVRPTFGTSLHCLILKKGFSRNLFLASGLITMYSKHDNIFEARQVFDEMHERDEGLWNSMIAGYSRMGFYREACSLFSFMINHNWADWKLVLSNFTLGSVLKACAGLGCARVGKSLHCSAIRLGLDKDVFVGGAVIDMYSKCGCLDFANRVFDRLGTRDLVIWNTLITACAQNDREDEAIELFYLMQCQGFTPNETTYPCILKASSVMADDAFGRGIHARVTKLGMLSDVFVGTAVVDMYSKFLEKEDAERAFGEIEKPNLVSFNVLITGYSLILGMHAEALRSYLELRTRGLRPDSFTFVGLFSSCSLSGAVAEGAQVRAQTLVFGLDSDVLVGNSIMTFYSKCGSIEDALKSFGSLHTRNAISWATVISGLAQNGKEEEALAHFCRMHKLSEKMDEFTLSSALKVIARWAAVEHVRPLHSIVIRLGLSYMIYVGSALIDVYSNCGVIEDSKKVFDEMPLKTVVSWNSLIMCYVQNGIYEEALLLFRNMMDYEVLPTPVTFVAVLCACSRAGLVEEGIKFYDIMVYNYKIPPLVEHCTCMVELLGRAGYLDQAEKFIINSPFSVDPSIWESLLSACRVHKNFDVASRATQHCSLLAARPSSSYTSLSNMYAFEELWDDVMKIRDLMEKICVDKEPRCSLSAA